MTVKNEKETALGATAFWFDTWTYWCWQKTATIQRVYNVDHGWAIRDVDPLFGWEGIVTNSPLFYDWGPNNNYPRSAFRNYRMGHFSNCVGPLCQHFYPENTLRSYADGTWAWETKD